MTNHHDEAKRLANRPYSTIVFLDVTTDDDPIYVALNPELEGCVSQGDTSEEAIENLALAREDFIYFLLEDGLNVPDPNVLDNRAEIFFSEYMQSETEILQSDKPDYLLT